MAFIKKISSTDPDKELVEKYRTGGSIEILGELYQRYMELVYGVCLKYFKEPEEAKDSVINIFEELVTKLKKHEVENFKAWLYQLTKNYCLMRLRKKKPGSVNIDIAVMHSGENDHPDDEMVKEQNYKQLQNCLEQLNGDQRKTIELFYLQNKCYKEIAGITAMEINTVRSYIQNGRRNLKICMEKNAVKDN